MKKATIALVFVCLMVLWLMLPVFLVSCSIIRPELNDFLTLTVRSGSCSGCFTIVLWNRTPWPILIRHAYWDVRGYVWHGPEPAEDFLLLPFGPYMSDFSAEVFWGPVEMGPVERVNVVLRAEATMLWCVTSDVEVTSW